MAEVSGPKVGSVVTIKALSGEKFVIGKILRGGMGEVYQLVPVRPIGPVLALKTYQLAVSREQFIREADLWISLGEQTHIARAMWFLEWDSRPAILGEWYEQTLSHKAAENWSGAKLINLAAGLIDGLEYAHRVGGIIHQDVKPANILLDRDEEPRLTDFGMARFANCTHGLGLECIDSSMVHAVTLGPVGGTPLYMAPELFAGQPPSVSTDIYSLGVTLYQVATGEHPYCGPETNLRLCPTLRTGPLEIFLKRYGKEVSLLVSLITAALQLDPTKRPSSYGALFRLIGRHSMPTVDCSPGNRVQDLITRAGFLRDTGRTQEAVELLEAGLAERPSNPELLNSFAVLLLKQGQTHRAYAIWASAVDCLKMTHGKHNHVIYLDPLVNLAWRLVDEGQFAKADALFTDMAGWCKDSPMVPYEYTEFGWWHLYEGRFEEAWQHITSSAKMKTPDERTLWCLTLTAWLSGKFSERAEAIAQMYLNPNVHFDHVTALLACMVGPFLQRTKQREMHALCFPRFEAELAEASEQMGLEQPDSLLSLPRGQIRKIIQAFDKLVTGGKYSGLI
jgi:serine/threonine protein kinase